MTMQFTGFYTLVAYAPDYTCYACSDLFGLFGSTCCPILRNVFSALLNFLFLPVLSRSVPGKAKKGEHVADGALATGASELRVKQRRGGRSWGGGGI